MSTQVKTLVSLISTLLRWYQVDKWRKSNELHLILFSGTYSPIMINSIMKGYVCLFTYRHIALLSSIIIDKSSTNRHAQVTSSLCQHASGQGIQVGSFAARPWNWTPCRKNLITAKVRKIMWSGHVTKAQGTLRRHMKHIETIPLFTTVSRIFCLMAESAAP